MDIAFCTEDLLTYTAMEFSRLLPDELAHKRRLLRCTECNGIGYFHNTSYDFRIPPFFGARCHVPGCSLAALEYDNSRLDAPDSRDQVLLMPGGKIIVEFEYGGYVKPEFDENVPPELIQARNHRNGYRPDASFHRCLNSLLRLLVNSPDFRNSRKRIDVNRDIDITVADFFVPLENVTEQYLGHYRGYWGVISDVRFDKNDSSVWFNSGGQDNVSFCMDKIHLTDFFKKYPVRDAEELSGAYLLVFGTLKYCPRKKLYCVIEDPCFMALR